MSLEVWLEEAEKNKNRLQNKMGVLKRALGQCSEKTKTDLKDFQDYLLAVEESLRSNTRMGGAYYDVTYMFEEVAKLAGQFDPPMDFLTRDGVKDALLDLMKVAGEEGETYPKPDIKPLSEEELKLARPKRVDEEGNEIVEKNKEAASDPLNVSKAEFRQAAFDASPLRLAAQYMAFKDLPKEVTAAQFLDAIASIPRREKNHLLIKTMQKQEAADALRDGMTEQFDLQYSKVLAEEYSKTRPFKDFRDEITKRYNERQITYAQLDLEMSALRALTPGMNDNEREDVKIPIGAFRDKLMELRQAEHSFDAAAYQQELADSYTDYADLCVETLDNIYGMQIEYHPEYLDPTKPKDSKIGYLPEIVAECLPSFDMPGLVIGGKSVSNREFASLANLAVYAPSIGGSYVTAAKNVNMGESTAFVRLDKPNKWVSADNHIQFVINCANSYRKIGDKVIATPDNRLQSLLHTMIPDARNMTKDALEAYQRGDVAPLAKLIANGLELGVNYSKYSPEVQREREFKKPLPIDWNDKSLMVAVNTDSRSNQAMMQGALDLLDRDPRLKEAVLNAGLKEEDLLNAKAFQMGRQVQKAGWAAMERLAEDANGIRVLSGPEKEQCVLAMLRMKAMVRNITETAQAGQNHPDYLKAVEEYNAFEEKLTVEAEENNDFDFFKKPEGAKLMKPKDCEVSVKMYSCIGLPPVYREMAKGGIAALDARINTPSKEMARNMNSREIMDGFQKEDGIFKKEGVLGKKIETTAKDVYDLLTKRYKAGELPYQQYADRLRVMRELTGDNPRAKIDLDTVNEALAKSIEENEIKRKENLDPLETRIESMIGTDSGKLAARVHHIDDIWRLTPRLNEDALPTGNPPRFGYTMEQFEQIKAIKEGPGENFLHLSGTKTISEDEFAVLGLAATHAFPEIGVFTMEGATKNTEHPNILRDPAKYADLIATFRNVYTTDMDHGDGKPRQNTGFCFKDTVVPAREKVVQALRSYRAGQGSPKELGKILGAGLHLLVKTTTVANNDGAGVMKSDAMLECAYIGRLAKFAERNPALLAEAMKEKYMTQEDLEKAKGFGMLYQLSVGADLAQKKLEDSAAGNIELSDDERKACVELMLRRKVLSDSACIQANRNLPDEKNAELLAGYSNRQKELEKSGLSKSEIREISNAETFRAIHKAIGQPDYLRTLGAKGMDYAKEMLDKCMPNRDAFLKLGDAEILAALKAKPLSQKDPFMNKEYTTKPVVEEKKEQNEPQRESKLEKSDPQAGAVLT